MRRYSKRAINIYYTTVIARENSTNDALAHNCPIFVIISDSLSTLIVKYIGYLPLSGRSLKTN